VKFESGDRVVVVEQGRGFQLAYGDIFTVTHVHDGYVYLDGGAGGGWNESRFQFANRPDFVVGSLRMGT
jgi:hypothetical protein